VRYLVSVAPEATGNDVKEDWAAEGEPVVPWYPATLENVFLSVMTFKKAACAKVADIADDPDVMASRLAEEYPGLPLSLHENYILAIAKAAHEFPVETVFRIFIGRNSAKLQAVKSEDIHVLWEEQPL
jgi:hypothetical protein